MKKTCYVSHQCPQCGGETIFDQEATGTKCRYCGTALMVVGGRSAWLNFLIKPKIKVKDTPPEITAIARKNRWKPSLVRSVIPFYYPFYRIRGQAIHWVTGEKRRDDVRKGESVEELKTRNFDLMRPGHTDLSTGLFSPGIRAQTLHLFLATRENAGGIPFLPMQLSREKFHDRVRHNTTEGFDVSDLFVLEEKTFLIWERYSILYFPLFLVEIREGEQLRLLLMDAVSGHLVRQIGHQEMETLLNNLGIGESQPPIENRLKLVPLICPECDGDLQSGTTAVIRFCFNCGRGWESGGSRLQERKCLWAGTEVMVRQEQTIFLPFWRRNAGDGGSVIPAFGVRSPHLLYNISRRYYNADFPVENIPYNCRTSVKTLPAELSPEEAMELMDVVVYTSRKARVENRKLDSLVLIPFSRRGPDLVDHYHGLAVPVSGLNVRMS